MAQNLIDQVRVSPSQFEVSVQPGQLLQSEEDNPVQHRVTLSRQVGFRRSGFGIKLVIPERGQPITRQVDQRLLNLVQRGTTWFHRLVTEGISPTLIAQAEGHSESLVQRMIYVAFLAPDIVKLIKRGDQPASLTSRTLLDALPLPPKFEDQRKLLGVSS